ncbi:hypothetical protein D5F01_LYC00049 [Larimichthys crocea]|uniref:Uncharacterized protein n=1 Tax=Larimichthys crocea TaxID=215358 RepID=A0A6G0J826_LARCR|nr:hypothetical protein D5F01_LYC00049 [Larimichthys crocea]
MLFWRTGERVPVSTVSCLSSLKVLMGTEGSAELGVELQPVWVELEPTLMAAGGAEAPRHGGERPERGRREAGERRGPGGRLCASDRSRKPRSVGSVLRHGAKFAEDQRLQTAAPQLQSRPRRQKRRRKEKKEKEKEKEEEEKEEEMFTCSEDHRHCKVQPEEKEKKSPHIRHGKDGATDRQADRREEEEEEEEEGGAAAAAAAAAAGNDGKESALPPPLLSSHNLQFL